MIEILNFLSKIAEFLLKKCIIMTKILKSLGLDMANITIKKYFQTLILWRKLCEFEFIRIQVYGRI